MNEYEGIFIIRPNLTEEAAQKTIAHIDGEITKNGGKIDNAEKWGRRNIAYPIKKNKEGIYYKLNFKSAPQNIPEMKKAYKLNEDILRLMVIKK